MKNLFTILFLLIGLLSFAQRPESLELIELYEQKKYDEAINKALEYLEKEPNYITFHLVLGRVYTDIGKYEKAIPHLDFTVANDSLTNWKKPMALEYLGICYFMLADYKKSQEFLANCIESNTRKSIIIRASQMNRLFGYDKYYKSWKIIETDNFRFHFQKMKESEIQSYMEKREEAFKFINSFFKASVPKKIDFFVWNSKSAAKKVLKSNLGFSNPNYCIVHSHFDQSKGHEMTHVISHYSSKILNKTGLINEGTAVFFDMLNRNDEQRVTYWINKNYEKIDIKKIWLNWKDYPQELTYPLSGLFVGKLIDTFGEEKFLTFYADQSYENAKKIFGDELDKIINEFEKKYNVYDN